MGCYCWCGCWPRFRGFRHRGYRHQPRWERSQPSAITYDPTNQHHEQDHFHRIPSGEPKTAGSPTNQWRTPQFSVWLTNDQQELDEYSADQYFPWHSDYVPTLRRQRSRWRGNRWWCSPCCPSRPSTRQTRTPSLSPTDTKLRIRGENNYSLELRVSNLTFKITLGFFKFPLTFLSLRKVESCRFSKNIDVF